MKKVLFLIFASLLVLGACGQDGGNSNKDDNKKSESRSDKKSNNPKKDKKSDSKDKSKDSSSDDKQQASSDNSNNDTASNESESTSKNDNGKTQSANGNNERPQGKQATQQQNNDQQSNNNQQSQQNNNNGYMTQDEINEWNRTKTTTHNESQMEKVPQENSGGHPSAFGKSDVSVGTQKTDSNGDTYIDATGK
ncbi:hypothetical protein [Staphylococcus saprophyticus]|uniref:hypothetical protein n=1 Tax=Staphylococcus saprophyticus TaxID=29385 RepID=UPI00380C05B8